MMKQKLLKYPNANIVNWIINKIIKLASGEADIYPRLAPTMKWDTAAHAILISVGGDLIDQKTNKSLKYNKENLLNNYLLI